MYRIKYHKKNLSGKHQNFFSQIKKQKIFSKPTIFENTTPNILDSVGSGTWNQLKNGFKRPKNWGKALFNLL